MTTPRRSADERLQALAAAGTARRRRADLKQALATGETGLGEVLRQAGSDEAVAQMRVLDLLRCLPRIGPVKAGKVMARLDIAENRRLRGLGRHQVDKLLAEFDPPPDGADGPGVPSGSDPPPAR